VPGCVLSIRGHFDVDAALLASSIPGCEAWREGEPSAQGEPWQDSGFSVWASRVGGGLQDQAEYVIRFLEEHKADLLGIVALAGVEDTHLDFGYDCRLHDEGVAMQGDCLPARLVALCGELGLAIMLSLYPTESCPD